MERTLFRLGIAAFLALVWSGPARAGEAGNGPGGADTARRGLVLAPDVCRGVVAHHPDPSIDYVPGQDAGVAPADLPGQEPLTVDPDTIAVDPRLPLVDLAQLPPSLQTLLRDADVKVGLITLRDGVPYLGDRRLDGDQQAGLAAACAGAVGQGAAGAAQGAQ